MLKPIKLIGEQKNVLFLPPTEAIQIKGVAGSGKTTVALYRAKHLVDTQSNLFEEARVAIFTYNKTLVNYINSLISQIPGGYVKDSDDLVPNVPPGLNVVVTNFHKWAYHFISSNGFSLYGLMISRADQKIIFQRLRAAHRVSQNDITNKRDQFFIEEISWIKGKLISSLEEYLDVKRVGRGTKDRVLENDKRIIWKIYQDYTSNLKKLNKVDFDDYALVTLKLIEGNPNFIHPFTHIVVDEAQDLNKAQILAISKIVSPSTKSISIIADAAQRIYKSGFTWSEVGLNVRGARTIELKKNYRNTVPIVRAALSLLENEDDKEEFTKVDTAKKGTVKPTIGYFTSPSFQELFLDTVLSEITEQNDFMSIVVLHRNRSSLDRVNDMINSMGYQTQILQGFEYIDFDDDIIKICTLSSIKGLEFNTVIILDLNEDIIPYPPGFSDDNDEYHISTERRLLYTAMTRAKKRLYLFSSSTNHSRYLNEINSNLVDIVDDQAV